MCKTLLDTASFFQKEPYGAKGILRDAVKRSKIADGVDAEDWT